MDSLPLLYRCKTGAQGNPENQDDCMPRKAPANCTDCSCLSCDFCNLPDLMPEQGRQINSKEAVHGPGVFKSKDLLGNPESVLHWIFFPPIRFCSISYNKLIKTLAGICV